MIVNPQYRQVAGFAGSVTQSGAVIKSAAAATRIPAGTPVKYKDGKVVALEGTEKAQDIFGIVMKVATPFEPFYPGDLIEVVHEGYVQVAFDEEADAASVRGGQVFFDTEKKLFTTDSTKVAVRAIWASDGFGDGIAEVQIFPFIPSAAA